MLDEPAQGASRSVRTYRLVEIDPGRTSSETFSAPDDDAALLRAIEVGTGRIVELWLGPHLIRRWSDDQPWGVLQ